MRKKERIKKFLNELGNIWEENYPDWRFGQLIVNVFSELERDPFFYEEDEMLEEFKRWDKK